MSDFKKVLHTDFCFFLFLEPFVIAFFDLIILRVRILRRLEIVYIIEYCMNDCSVPSWL